MGISSILDAMVDGLGIRNEVDKDIEDNCQKKEAAQHLAKNYAHAD